MAFLFAPTGTGLNPSTTRIIHIRRLYDVMNLCIQRNDLQRATRAWSILARCKEVDWRTIWSTSVHILAEDLDEREKASQKVDFLRVMMLQNSEDRETILKELVLRLILSGQHREALDEVELFLPSFPYQDNPLLHLYAGLIALHLAQPTSEVSSLNPTLLRNSQSHFERTKALDPDNEIAEAFLWKIEELNGTNAQPGDESDEELLEISGDIPKRKRVRIGAS
ncbi:hypothetical protein B0H11DRAFT_1022404 [Mycena galericulata]|nr:hypothetical protein B0H11DRAFT_1022404 [Mycena galericulata]